MKPTTPLLTLLSIPGALSTCTVRFYENASCTQTPGWPAYECGTGEHAFPDAQYAQVENNCGDGKKVYLTLTRENGDGTAMSTGDVWDSGCQRIEVSIEAEYFTLVCA